MPTIPTSSPVGARSPFVVRLVGTLVLFNLLLALLAGTTLRRNLRRSEAEAQATTKNLCLVLDQSLSGLIREVDLGLLAVKNEYERQRSNGGIEERTLQHFIEREFTYLPQLNGLRIADQVGRVRYGTDFTRSTQAIADRDYFAIHRDRNHEELVFSKPLLGRTSHRWVMILARRLESPEGDFAGVVYAPILLDTIESRLAAVQLGKRSVVSLRNTRLELIGRYPTLGRRDETVGRKQVSPDLDWLLASGLSEGTLFSPFGTDNIGRIVTFRRINRYPFYVFVGIAKDEYLASWWKDAIKLGFFVGLTFLATAISGMLIYRTRKREYDAQRILESEQEKYRIVADNTCDWEFWLGPDGSTLYTSPSCETVTGHDASDFYADPSWFTRVVHPEDRQRFEEHRHSVSTASAPTTLIQFRIVHRDGTIRWIEHLCRPILDESGRYRGVRGSNRDITERQLMEFAKERAVAQVHSLEGIIPICMYCKKIRDDKNSWSQLERYISEHSEAEFSHGICPSCFDAHRADFE